MKDPLGGLAPEPAPPQERAPQSRPFTPSTYALLAVLLAFFLAEGALGGDWAVESGYALVRMGALYVPALHDGDFWRIGSYAFLHIGWVHLFGNAWSLWALMRDLEVLYGSNMALGFFATTALAGGAASVGFQALRGGPPVLAAGASGGLFGLFGATVALLFRLWPRLVPQAKTALLRMLLLNVLVVVFIALRFPVDNAAHAGGFLSGAVLALLAPMRRQERHAGHVFVQGILIAGALALAAMEGAAVAWAVHPRLRSLRGNGVEAQVPGVMVPLDTGVAGIPGEAILEISLDAEPLQIGAGADAVHIGEHTFVRERGVDKGAEVVRLAASEGTGRVRIEMWCGGQFCRGAKGDRLLEPVARSLKTIR